MKKSGLADSPFFVNNSPQEVFPPVAHPSPIDHIRSLYAKPPEQMNKRTIEQMNERSDERMNTRTNEQMNERSNVQVKSAAEKKPPRPIHRQSYDIFDDQAEAIEALCLKWRKERGRRITKGEAMRELLGEVLATKS